MDEQELMAANNQAASTAPSPDGDADAGQEDGAGDTGPLSKIELEPAEEGGVIATHHPKVPERVKTMDHPSAKPRKHALKKDEVEAHVKKHAKRLKP